MKSCPRCKSEYDDDVFKCPSCGCICKDVIQGNEADWVHLTTVANDIEYELIAGLLETGNIPSTMRTIGVDRIVGAPLAGIEVLVPRERYEEALQLINSEIDESILDEEEMKTEGEDEVE